MVDLTDIIVAVLTLISALISAFVIPYLKTKVDSGKFEKIKAWVKVAVEAAEMIYVGVGRGEEKKAYVLEFLQNKGFTIDMTSIDNLIESAVLELKKG